MADPGEDLLALTEATSLDGTEQFYMVKTIAGQPTDRRGAVELLLGGTPDDLLPIAKIAAAAPSSNNFPALIAPTSTDAADGGWLGMEIDVTKTDLYLSVGPGDGGLIYNENLAIMVGSARRSLTDRWVTDDTAAHWAEVFSVAEAHRDGSAASALFFVGTDVASGITMNADNTKSDVEIVANVGQTAPLLKLLTHGLDGVFTVGPTGKTTIGSPDLSSVLAPYATPALNAFTGGAGVGLYVGALDDPATVGGVALFDTQGWDANFRTIGWSIEMPPNAGGVTNMTGSEFTLFTFPITGPSFAEDDTSVEYYRTAHLGDDNTFSSYIDTFMNAVPGGDGAFTSHVWKSFGPPNLQSIVEIITTTKLDPTRGQAEINLGTDVGGTIGITAIAGTTIFHFGQDGNVMTSNVDVYDGRLRLAETGSGESPFEVAPTGAVTVRETTDPDAPTTNYATYYARDNGAGKTQFCVRFATGAVQVLATQP